MFCVSSVFSDLIGGFGASQSTPVTIDGAREVLRQRQLEKQVCKISDLGMGIIIAIDHDIEQIPHLGADRIWQWRNSEAGWIDTLVVNTIDKGDVDLYIYIIYIYILYTYLSNFSSR